jgi:hypothetical protein
LKKQALSFGWPQSKLCGGVEVVVPKKSVSIISQRKSSIITMKAFAVSALAAMAGLASAMPHFRYVVSVSFCIILQTFRLMVNALPEPRDK